MYCIFIWRIVAKNNASNALFTYVASLFHNYSPPRTMRSSSAKLLIVPRHDLSLGSRDFRISAPTTLNSLPQNVRECSSLASFRNHLKTYYFSSAFSALWHLTHMHLDSNLTTALYKSFTYLLTYLLKTSKVWQWVISLFGLVLRSAKPL